MTGQLTTASGAVLIFTHVKLYNVLHINRVNALQAKAQSASAPISSPYGALGSFSFVTGVIAANMLAEHFVNSARQQESNTLFAQSFDLAERIRDLGEFVPVNVIERIEVPLPSVWRATIHRKIKESGRKTTEAKIITSMMIHNGDPYVTLRCPAGDVCVFWDKAEAYSIQTPNFLTNWKVFSWKPNGT